MKLSALLDLLFEGAREDFVVKQHGQQLSVRYQADTRKQESPENVVAELSKADPTKNMMYLQWIARMYVLGAFRMEDTIRVKETLQEFERVKSKLQNKDINSYKKMSDLYAAIEPFEGQDIISGKQAVKQKISKFGIDSPEAKKFFENGEAELFYRGSTIDVVIPLTEKASCFFGQNTKWCTARNDERNMFDMYHTDSTPLYIIFCKDGTRYQFYYSDDEYIQLMDKNDEEVDTLDLVENIPELKTAFKELATRKKIWELMDQTPENNLKAVKENGWAIARIKNQTIELCLAAVEQDPSSLQAIKQLTPEICMAAVQEKGWALYYVPEKMRTEEICLAAVRENGLALEYVENQTPEICLIAVSDFGKALEFVKDQTPEICLTAVKGNPRATRFIKDPKIKEWVEEQLSKADS